jgi:hypothetical protein
MNYKNIVLTGLLLASAASQAATPELKAPSLSTPKKLSLAALYAGCSATALLGAVWNRELMLNNIEYFYKNSSQKIVRKSFARNSIASASCYILAFLSAKKAVQTLKS